MDKTDMNIPLHKLVSKGFFNTLPPDVCHHILKLAQERLEETEGAYRRRLNQSKWDANKALLGKYLVQSIIDGDPIECDVTAECVCHVGFDQYIPLTDVFKGTDVLREEYNLYVDREQPASAPSDTRFLVRFRNAVIPELDGCEIAENIEIRA